MTNAPQKAHELFDSGYMCAESVLIALAEHQGIQSELIPKIATGFCSGMARTSGECGALTGAIMGLGLKYGRNVNTDTSHERFYTIVQELIDTFVERYGSTQCTPLAQCDLSTEQGRQYFKEHERKKKCMDYAAGVTEIALELLNIRTD